jgi:hypothetical protein
LEAEGAVLLGLHPNSLRWPIPSFADGI